MIYMPNCEWSHDPLPSQPATHLTVIVLFNFTNKLAGASGLRLFRVAQPLALLYRVTKTGYEEISPSMTRARRRAWISSKRR
jgi:hypothetical protein